MKEKSAVITGATKGIGRAVAEHLGSKGYNLLLIARTGDLLNELKGKLYEMNSAIYVETVQLDVSDATGIENCISSFAEITKSIDILFNNAGYVKRGTSEINSIELATMLNVNLMGSINVIKSVVPHMKFQNSGYIMNVCSRSAEIPRPLLGGYAASKAGLLAYSDALYKELKDTKIKVTAICPGFVDTDMTKDVNEDRENLIKVNDICIAVDFLISLSSAVALKKLSFESITQIGGYC